MELGTYISMKAAIYNHTIWVATADAKQLQTLLAFWLDEAGFTTLNFIEHQFNPVGYTAIWLLSESHLALHTFPEENKAYIELSSCNETKNSAFSELVANSNLKIIAS